MGLESAGFISELVAANPTGADDYATADDHIRLLKAVLQAQFPNFDAAAVNATPADLDILAAAAAAGLTATELMFLNGVTSGLQAQIDAKGDAVHTHATADVTSGAFADARIAESNVTQHEAAIDHDALTNFVGAEHVDWAGAGAENIEEDRLLVATETVKGAVERATQGEVDARVDTTRYVSPATIGSIPRSFIKTADEQVNNSVTLQDDNHLIAIPLETNTRYLMRCFFFCIDASSAGGYRLAFIFTNTPQEAPYALTLRDATGGVQHDCDNDMATSVVSFSFAGTAAEIITVDAVIRSNATTGGTFKLQWAQKTASVGDTEFLAGSYIQLTKIPSG